MAKGNLQGRVTIVLDGIEGIEDRLHDMKAVFQEFRSDVKNPSNYQKPGRVDANYQKHIRFSAGKKTLRVRSSRPFLALPAKSFVDQVTASVEEFVMGRKMTGK